MDIKLYLSYYASIMLNAFGDLLYSKLCWHNRPGPTEHTPGEASWGNAPINVKPYSPTQAYVGIRVSFA